jgi:hypothetical protein
MTVLVSTAAHILSAVIARLAAFAEASARPETPEPRRSLGEDGIGRSSIPETLVA